LNLHAQTFVAPFGSNPDPNIVYHNGWYYYTGTSGSGVTLKKAQTLEGLKHTPNKKIFSSANGGPCCDYWAPELHRINNSWYIYYTAKYSGQGQRTYVIENTSDDPMSGTWVHKGKIYDTQNDVWSIDGTVFETNGKYYFVWSSVAKASDGDKPQRLYIALMTNPWTLQPGRVLISSPSLSWEKDGNVNEGPAVVKHNGKIFLTYSANGCWTENYLIGMLYMTEGGNPLNASSWTKYSQPLFAKLPSRDVYGPGHHSFFKSPDGKETWFVYHATPDPGGACDMGRTTRAQKVNWDAKGFPSLGLPDPTGAWLTAPTGEPTLPVGNVLPNGIYKIKPTSSTNKVLDVSGCSAMRGTNVQQWQDNGLDCQKWHIIATPDGYYSIEAVKGGLVLDVEDCGTSNGTNVRLWTPGGSDCQKWIIEEVTSGVYRIKSKKSGKVLDIQFGGDNNGANLQIYQYLGNAQQHFTLQPLETYSAVALQSYNFPGYFIRHTTGQSRIDKNVSPQQDEQWRMVPGLAGKGVSFESVNAPNSYLRHSNGKVSLQVNDGSTIYREDATFYVRAGLADASKVSFESYNYPGNYIRHRNYLLYSETVSAGTGYKDATFSIGAQPVAPLVSLTSPANNTSYSAPATVHMVATASVPYGTISKVEFYNGTKLIGTEYVAPYTYSWKNVPSGTYTITAKAIDNNGVSSISAARTVKVTAPANQTPIVSLTAPANNATFTAPVSVTIAASASDNDGTIAKVEFFQGSTKLGEKATAPYTYTWNAGTTGVYTITAKATDNKGATTTSAARTITINSAANQSPVVTLTAPGNNATYVAPASITITASAIDKDGSISKVEFFRGTTKLGEKASSPYTYTWTGVSAGTFTITAKATDNKGATTTSSVRTVTVTEPQTDVCSSLIAYAENGNYVAGSKVKNVSNQYECKPWPYSGWCNGAAWAYAPGTGAYWTDAWTLVGSCSATARMASENASSIQLSNMPNPFSDYTDIQITLTTGENVSVIVYDQTGHEVGVVMKGDLSAGTHHLPFDGSQLKAGLYYVQFNSAEETVRQKMVKLE